MPSPYSAIGSAPVDPVRAAEYERHSPRYIFGKNGEVLQKIEAPPGGWTEASYGYPAPSIPGMPNASVPSVPNMPNYQSQQPPGIWSGTVWPKGGNGPYQIGTPEWPQPNIPGQPLPPGPGNKPVTIPTRQMPSPTLGTFQRSLFPGAYPSQTRSPVTLPAGRPTVSGSSPMMQLILGGNTSNLAATPTLGRPRGGRPRQTGASELGFEPWQTRRQPWDLSFMQPYMNQLNGQPDYYT